MDMDSLMNEHPILLCQANLLHLRNPCKCFHTDWDWGCHISASRLQISRCSAPINVNIHLPLTELGAYVLILCTCWLRCLTLTTVYVYRQAAYRYAGRRILCLTFVPWYLSTFVDMVVSTQTSLTETLSQGEGGVVTWTPLKWPRYLGTINDIPPILDIASWLCLSLN